MERFIFDYQFKDYADNENVIYLACRRENSSNEILYWDSTIGEFLDVDYAPITISEALGYYDLLFEVDIQEGLFKIIYDKREVDGECYTLTRVCEI